MLQLFLISLHILIFLYWSKTFFTFNLDSILYMFQVCIFGIIFASLFNIPFYLIFRKFFLQKIKDYQKTKSMLTIFLSIQLLVLVIISIFPKAYSDWLLFLSIYFLSVPPMLIIFLTLNNRQECTSFLVKATYFLFHINIILGWLFSCFYTLLILSFTGL